VHEEGPWAAKNGLLPTGDLNLSSDTQQQMQDLSIEFINDKSITMDDYIALREKVTSTEEWTFSATTVW
jgi:hypothetical protein